MKYAGSKNRIAKHIVPILQKTIDENDVKMYVEPFVGGANIIDKIKCEERIGYDSCDYLIALLDLASKDFESVPKEGSRELWDKGKEYAKTGAMSEDMTLAEIGAIAWLGCFNARGFPGGYAKPSKDRDPYGEAYRNLQKQSPNLAGIKFEAKKYQDIGDIKGAVIYCDPPYQGTMSYGYVREGRMDYDHFWQWVRDLSKDNYVFVSEQQAPEDFNVLWEGTLTRKVHRKNAFQGAEKLFVWKGGLFLTKK